MKMLQTCLRVFCLSAYLFLNSTAIYAQTPPGLEQKPPINHRGIWVTCFSEKRVLYSKEAALELVEFCKTAKIDEVYLQLYRGGQAYYDSKICPRERYEEMLKAAGMDAIDFLLQEANKNKLKVFAWVNVLCLAENRNADIFAKFGDVILTKDQYLRSSARDEKINESDKYYLRDKQLFLEPGDPRVAEYTLLIVNEIVARYPAISGVHLDYLRYPYPVPYLPNSRFNQYGLSYGYGEKNIAQFKEKTGLDPLTLKDEKDNYLVWDNWKRDQVTALVESIARTIKMKSPNFLVSCAVIPSPSQAYSVAFQDWPLWLEKGLVDYVVIMNYTRDNRLAKEILKSALSQRGNGKVFMGMGVFLMKDEPSLFIEQYKIIQDLGPDGIVFFSYDDVNKEGIMKNIF